MSSTYSEQRCIGTLKKLRANESRRLLTSPRIRSCTIPTHELLSAAQRAELLEAHISMGEREDARYYTLSDKDLQIIRNHRRDHNRLGFSIQLAIFAFLDGL